MGISCTGNQKSPGRDSECDCGLPKDSIARLISVEGENSNTSIRSNTTLSYSKPIVGSSPAVYSKNHADIHPGEKFPIGNFTCR